MEKELYPSVSTNIVFYKMRTLADKNKYYFITPELFAYVLVQERPFIRALNVMGLGTADIESELAEYLDSLDLGDDPLMYVPEVSVQFDEMLVKASKLVVKRKLEFLDIPELVQVMLSLKDSTAAYILNVRLGEDRETFIDVLSDIYTHIDIDLESKRFLEIMSNQKADNAPKDEAGKTDEQGPSTDETFAAGDLFNVDVNDMGEAGHEDDNDIMGDDDDMSPFDIVTKDWHQLVTDMNEAAQKHNPLIGREAEMERTIQVLCRKDKNNPLHVGEPGVGKTALVYGLAQRINKGKVPSRLKNNHIYLIDMGTLLADTQFRGDFEKRIKNIIEGAAKEGNVILYIDEIHNLVGAGRTEGSSLDAANILKPYLESGEIKFIGSTTYAEYNKYFSTQGGLIRRFQQIDIKEPSVEETLNIVKRLKKNYEKFHNVTYRPSALEYAVRMSAKYIHDRYLPDKAIDIIDEAGAYREVHPDGDDKNTVDSKLMEEILTRVCKIDAKALKEDDNSSLQDLQQRIGTQIYGQDKAVEEVTMAVEMAKAGLGDDTKPLASLLFVGPTGVGKTEVAKVLAKELGISLVRFDMSEYTEKHTVAKLIGSPAGYVGYEDGGLLTDAIRKSPNCVLLLDEIEKAHSDIYNILLQVMDYASLTDSKGRKANFRNVILIMTSNAGAQYAHQAGIGFTPHTTAGEAMMKQVKKTFKPEFINRLSAIAVFNDMDRHMASLILNKKIGELQQKLSLRKVNLMLTQEAEKYLLDKGFTAEYGAREIERVIARELKPLLVKEILFGKLKRGGDVEADIKDMTLTLKPMRHGVPT